jgi:hypothetical protein
VLPNFSFFIFLYIAVCGKGDFGDT